MVSVEATHLPKNKKIWVWKGSKKSVNLIFLKCALLHKKKQLPLPIDANTSTHS